MSKSFQELEALFLFVWVAYCAIVVYFPLASWEHQTIRTYSNSKFYTWIPSNKDSSWSKVLELSLFLAESICIVWYSLFWSTPKWRSPPADKCFKMVGQYTHFNRPVIWQVPEAGHPRHYVVHSLAMLAIICSELSAICKIIRCENEGFGLGSSGSNEQRRLMAQPVEQMVDASWLPLQQRTCGFFKIALMPYERGPLPGYWLSGLLRMKSNKSQ